MNSKGEVVLGIWMSMRKLSVCKTINAGKGSPRAARQSKGPGQSQHFFGPRCTILWIDFLGYEFHRGHVVSVASVALLLPSGMIIDVDALLPSGMIIDLFSF